VRQEVLTRYGSACDGEGAPSVTWVLDERGVVGDNNLDRVSPVDWERGRVSVRRPSSRSGWRARR